MELLVVIAIIVVLASIAYPVYIKIKMSSNKGVAMNIMKQLGSAMSTYAGQHDGFLPSEDSTGKDTWETAKLPTADKAWYNALLRLMPAKSAGDFSKENRPAAFYTPENVLYLPGANYPESKRLERPYFAIAMNTKLFRKGKDGLKPDVRLSNIQNTSRTVAFLEQGLPGEPKAHDSQSKNDYDGSPKGSAKSFVGRYNKRGMICFFDGHADEVSGKDLLNSSGEIEWTTETAKDPSAILWTADPNEDPNQKAQ
jgi:prepilin-type processing-associated H-X9-DG protein